MRAETGALSLCTECAIDTDVVPSLYSQVRQLMDKPTNIRKLANDGLITQLEHVLTMLA